LIHGDVPPADQALVPSSISAIDVVVNGAKHQARSTRNAGIGHAVQLVHDLFDFLIEIAQKPEHPKGSPWMGPRIVQLLDGRTTAIPPH